MGYWFGSVYVCDGVYIEPEISRDADKLAGPHSCEKKNDPY